MRFSSAQLRMLQESLAPSLPNMSAPPEMVAAACAPVQPHLAHAHAHQQVSHEKPGQTTLPGWPIPCAYLTCLAAAAAAWAYWSAHLLVLILSPLPLTLAAHALFAAHSRLAQGLGLACALVLPAVCLSPWPGPALLCAAVLASAFFSAAAQGPQLLRSASAALTLLLAFLASCALYTEAPQVRTTICLFIGAAVCAQSCTSVTAAAPFRLVCAVAR